MTTDTALRVFRQPLPEALAKLRAAMADTTPPDGPFMSTVQLTDYRDEPGYAITAVAETTAPSRARQLREEAIGR